MIQISIDKTRIDTLRRTMLEMNIDCIEGSDQGNNTITIFLLCDAADAFYLGSMFAMNRTEEIRANVYRNR